MLKMKINTLNFLSLSFLSLALAQFQCGTDFSTIGTAPTSGSVPFSLSLSKTASQNVLCLLVRVSTRSDVADLDAISSSSKLSDYNIVPIARSYQGGDWQRSAGPYAQELELSCPELSSVCDLQIPILPQLPEGRFVLMPFQYSVEDDRALVSRFFHQTTFGPTMSMIDDWDYSADSLSAEMAKWVKDQMDTSITPMTIHRQFLRERFNGQLEEDEEDPSGSRKQMFKVRNPCDAGSRWLLYSFSADDKGEELTVTQMPDGSYALSVNGVLRTVVSQWKDEFYNDIGTGVFSINWRLDETVGGRFGVSTSDIYVFVFGGNPPVNVPQDTANVNMMDLPPIDSFDRSSVINYDDVFHDDTLFLNTSFTTTSPICNTFDNMNTINIVGNFSPLQDTNSPTSSPTYSPTEYITPIPVTRVGDPCGNFFESALCEICTGDCDRDSDCEGDLLCFQRDSGEEAPPGCTFEGATPGLIDTYNDFCYRPQPGYISDIGDCNASNKCGMCQGDCDSDADCADGLICFQRYGFEEVPGCLGAGSMVDSSSTDICIPSPYVNYKYTQARYGRYVELEENTLASPIPNGGADLETCSNPVMNWNNMDTCVISTSPDVCTTNSYEELPSGSAVVVCGSPNEVSNDPFGPAIFQIAYTSGLKGDSEYADQKKSAWTMIALSANDQLRQRVAWALSQILVITPNQIENVEFSEMYLNYYDIFVKNAFTNYYDILKEVSYSPMMGEMLGFVGSKSMPYVLKDKGLYAFPDENYAREIMQLFSIGLLKLNIDGTLVLDNDGQPIQTYSAEDIQTFARGWTGFDHAFRRSNVEAYYWDPGNRIDPMILRGEWRDHSPKLDLSDGYIGDRYPLCADLPEKHFLRRGASYRLLGSSKYTLMHNQNDWWFTSGKLMTGLELDVSSELYDKLCNAAVEGGPCNFLPTVTLDTNLGCDSLHPECSVDDLRLIKVQSNPDIYYEYIRVPCVGQTFYENSKTVQLLWPYEAMCANADLALATDTCCETPAWGYTGGSSSCKYSIEKVKFSTSESRCAAMFESGGQCPWVWVYPLPDECNLGENDVYFWASADHCKLQAKVSRNGMISLVHNPVVDRFSRYKTEVNVDIDNLNYFRVAWEDQDAFPSPQNSCGNIGVCSLLENGEECLCDISISEEQVFTSLPSSADVLSQLFIGGFDVTMSEGYSLLESSGVINVYEKLGGGYNIDTLFEIEYFGEPLFLKNMRSTVYIGDYSFRNPVQFLDPAQHEGRDAHYETEAILKHYFRHPNVAPFLAVRLIKRFGTSNPSPRYVEDVATAFISGEYIAHGQTYGDRRYGSMEATIAAIVMHDEARNALLDSDPTAGSLREPLLKLIAFMRSMEFNTNSINPEIRLKNLDQKIGQEVYAIPNVFSYFLPEFAAAGHIDDASITSPEAQVMNGPKLTSFVNGLFSLVDLGLNDCFGGFGDRIMGSCNRLLNGQYNSLDYSRGYLTYAPLNSANSSVVIDDLTLLLTAGRMSSTNKMILQDAYENLGGVTAVQKLITVTPEFHATGLVQDSSLLRSDAGVPEESSNRYKSIIILNLSGGADSFNILVPHSECDGKDMYEEYKSVRSGIALNRTSLLQIDTTGSHQICNKFGIHPQLGVLQSMYNDGDLSFISNVGVLQEYASKEDWRKKTDDTVLFSHNTQTSEVQNVDIFEAQAGRGVGGRLLDVLGGNGLSANAISAKDAAEALFSRVTPLIVVPSLAAYDKFDPMSADLSDPDILIDKVKALNSETNLGSSLFTETYSSTLIRGLSENNLLYNALRDTTLNTTFPGSSIGRQFETVATMMKTKTVRGVDRDIFFVEQGGYDMHSNLLANFENRAMDLNESIQAFIDEIKLQGLWNDVTVVAVTEFARTLTTNTGSGSDHAWGGNMFVFGGDIDGGKILGEYPTDLTDEGPLIVNKRGVVLPTTPYDAIWNGVAQWFGVTSNADLDIVLPNRNKFTLFDTMTLYGYLSTSSPTISHAPSKSLAPSQQPSVSLVPSMAPTIDTSSIIDFDWLIPAAPGYEIQTVTLGDTVRFRFSSFHNVYKSVTGDCPDPNSDQEANKIGDDYVNGVLYTFTSIGEITFYCAAGNGAHCAAGQIVTFKVLNPDDATESPSSAPTMNRIIQFAGNPCRDLSGDRGNCIACTGDCDKDTDCLGDLRCAQRGRWDGLEEVPGCSFLPGDPSKTTDYDFCFEPQIVAPGVANYVGECGADNGYLCGECEGDCDSSDDCESGLICKSRSGLESVGGCTGGLSSDMYGKDICVRPPTTSPSPSVAPTESQTLNPSISVSDAPSQAPSILSETPTDTPSSSLKPSTLPSRSPSNLPTIYPSVKPTGDPSISPSLAPTDLPSKRPTFSPVIPPTAFPTDSPTPQSYIVCRQRWANRKKTNCMSISGCRWSANSNWRLRCQPTTPAPTSAPSKSPTSPPSSSPSLPAIAVLHTYAISSMEVTCPFNKTDLEESLKSELIAALQKDGVSVEVSVTIMDDGSCAGRRRLDSHSVDALLESTVTVRDESINFSTDLFLESASNIQNDKFTLSNIEFIEPPSAVPSLQPSSVPTKDPVSSPSFVPTQTPTVNPTAMPTPQFYLTCRQRPKNRNRKKCLQTTGCRWITGVHWTQRCQPITPAPTQSPTKIPTASPTSSPTVSVITVESVLNVEVGVTCPFDQVELKQSLKSDFIAALPKDSVTVEATVTVMDDTPCSGRRFLQQKTINVLIEAEASILDDTTTFSTDTFVEAAEAIASDSFEIMSVEVIESTSSPSSTPSKSPTESPSHSVSPTESPSSSSTPEAWLACRTRKANRKRKFCRRIPGCVWTNGMCKHTDAPMRI